MPFHSSQRWRHAAMTLALASAARAAVALQPLPPRPAHAQAARPALVGLRGLPASGTLSGRVVLEAAVAVPPGAAVERVEFALSAPCARANTDREAPYYFLGDSGPRADPPHAPAGWDTAACPDGSYTLTVRVFDAAGRADRARFALRVQRAPAPTPSPTSAAGPAPTPTPTAATPSPTPPLIAATATPSPTLTPAATPTRTPTPTTARTPTAAPAQPTLLDRYQLTRYYESAGGEPSDYEETVYRPRQFAGSGYAGWDYLTAPRTGIERTYGPAEWFTVTINRPARLGIVWRGGGAPPAWITSAWAAAGGTTLPGGGTYPVYTRDVAAGTHAFHGVKDTEGGPPVGDTYWVLLAEQGGVPSAAPAQRGVPDALPNATCPAWVHDQHTTTVDGVVYRTWHRQIDPVYWCSFRHEHGSDPSLFGDGAYRPAFGRSAAAAGIAENHEGFKIGVYTAADASGAPRDWLLHMHFGTANAQGAACNRFHEVGLALADAATGELLADVMAMADMGASVENTTLLPLNPQPCPGANDLARSSSGARLLPVQNGSGGPGTPTMYEPWRSDFSRTIVGLLGTFSLNTPDPIAICADLQCSRNVPTGLKGARRFYNVIGQFGVDASRAAATGVFYTDGFARELRAGAGPGALRQYVKPGVDVRNVYAGDNHTIITATGGVYGDRFRARYYVEPGNPAPQQGNTVELEGSLSGPN